MTHNANSPLEGVSIPLEQFAEGADGEVFQQKIAKLIELLMLAVIEQDKKISSEKWIDFNEYITHLSPAELFFIKSFFDGECKKSINRYEFKEKAQAISARANKEFARLMRSLNEPSTGNVQVKYYFSADIQ